MVTAFVVAVNLIERNPEFAGPTFNAPFNANSELCPGGWQTQPPLLSFTFTPACGQAKLKTENPFVAFEVRTTATLPYFGIDN